MPSLVFLNGSLVLRDVSVSSAEREARAIPISSVISKREIEYLMFADMFDCGSFPLRASSKINILQNILWGKLIQLWSTNPSHQNKSLLKSEVHPRLPDSQLREQNS